MTPEHQDGILIVLFIKTPSDTWRKDMPWDSVCFLALPWGRKTIHGLACCLGKHRIWHGAVFFAECKQLMRQHREEGAVPLRVLAPQVKVRLTLGKSSVCNWLQPASPGDSEHMPPSMVLLDFCLEFLSFPLSDSSLPSTNVPFRCHLSG